MGGREGREEGGEGGREGGRGGREGREGGKRGGSGGSGGRGGREEGVEGGEEEEREDADLHITTMRSTLQAHVQCTHCTCPLCKKGYVKGGICHGSPTLRECEFNS